MPGIQSGGHRPHRQLFAVNMRDSVSVCGGIPDPGIERDRAYELLCGNSHFQETADRILFVWKGGNRSGRFRSGIVLIISHGDQVIGDRCDLCPVVVGVEVIGRDEVDTQDQPIPAACDRELSYKLGEAERIRLFHIFKINIDSIQIQFLRVIDQLADTPSAGGSGGKHDGSIHVCREVTDQSPDLQILRVRFPGIGSGTDGIHIAVIVCQ